MSTIYLITSGEYSDYRVHAAYTDKAQAALAVEVLGAAYFQVEECPLDQSAEVLREGMRVFEVSVRNGNWSADQGSASDFFDLHQVYPLEQFKKTLGFSVCVLATDQQQALKAGMERIREFRALAGVTHDEQAAEEAAAREHARTLKERYEREQRIAKAKKAAEADFIFRNQGRINAMMLESMQKRERLDKEMGEELQRELKRIERETE